MNYLRYGNISLPRPDTEYTIFILHRGFSISKQLLEISLLLSIYCLYILGRAQVSQVVTQVTQSHSDFLTCEVN